VNNFAMGILLHGSMVEAILLVVYLGVEFQILEVNWLFSQKKKTYVCIEV
jgi:hypothetical protein